MSDYSTNLTKSAPKEFEIKLVPPQETSDSANIALDPTLHGNIEEDIKNLTGNHVAFVEEDLLYGEFVKNLKEFFEEQDATNAKSDIDDKLTTISSEVDKLSTNKENIGQDIEKLNPEELVNVDSTEDRFKLEIDSEFVKQLVENILGIINFNTIVNSTIENTITTIKSIIDGNADEFKNTLNEQLNGGLEVSKFKKVDSENGKDFGEKPKEEKQEQVEVQQGSTEEQLQVLEYQEKEADKPLINEPIPPQPEQQEQPIERKESAQKPQQEQSPKKDDKSNKQMSDFEAQQKKLDLQRKKKMLEIDKQLSDINGTYLRKLIETQDIVEEYDARKANTQKDKKKKKKSGDDKDGGLSFGRNKFSWSKLGIGLGIGALVALWVLFRGYSRHERVKKYIEQHKKDKDSKDVNSDLNEEIQFGDKTTKPLEKHLDETDNALNEAIPKVDKTIKDVNNANHEVDKKFGKEDERPSVEISQPIPNNEPIPTQKEQNAASQNVEVVSEEGPQVDLDEGKVKDIFEESHEGLSEAMVDSIDASLTDIKSEMDSGIEAHQEIREQKSSEIASLISDQQERLKALRELMDESSEGLKEEGKMIQNTSEAYERATEDSNRFNKEKEGEREETLSQIEKNQEKAREEIETSVQEMEESKQEGEKLARQTAEQNAKNKEVLDQKNKEMSQTTVPKAELDAANQAAKEVASSMEASIDEMHAVQTETISQQTSAVMANVKDVNSKAEELASKSQELSDNVRQLEAEAEMDSNNAQAVDAAAAESLKEREVIQAEYDLKAVDQIDKLFNEFLNSNLNQEKNDNLVLMDKVQLSQFYALLHNTKNLIATLVIKKSEERGLDSINFEANKYLDADKI